MGFAKVNTEFSKIKNEGNIIVESEKINISMPETSLTLIIPYFATKETFHFATKKLLYYSKEQKDVDVIWALSGEKKYRDKVEFMINKLHNPRCSILKKNARNIHGAQAFIEKILQAANYAKTPYILLCAVDDFVLPRAIEKGVCILDTSPDVAAVYGKCLIQDFNKEFFSQIYPNRMENSPIERIRNTLNIYGPTFYSIQRRGSFIKRLEKVREYLEIRCIREDLNNLELCMALDLAKEGKIASLDELFTVRQCHDKSSGSYVEPFDVSVATGSFSQFVKVYYEFFRRDLPNISFKEYKSWFTRYTLRYLLITLKSLIFGLLNGRYRFFDFLKLMCFLFLKSCLNLHRPSGDLDKSDLMIMQSNDFKILKDYLS